jgi:hypothetical protein
MIGKTQVGWHLWPGCWHQPEPPPEIAPPQRLPQGLQPPAKGTHPAAPLGAGPAGRAVPPAVRHPRHGCPLPAPRAWRPPRPTSAAPRASARSAGYAAPASRSLCRPGSPTRSRPATRTNTRRSARAAEPSAAPTAWDGLRSHTTRTVPACRVAPVLKAIPRPPHACPGPVPTVRTGRRPCPWG